MRLLGRKGEDLGARFLRDKGYRVLARNYKTPAGEIDLIAEDNGTVVFVEVKTRSGDAFGQPFEAVDRRKREKLRKVALSYLKRLKSERPARFDVLSIEVSASGGRIEHIIDAFE